MQQVLFHIPIFQGFFGPEGLPINAYGVMLFVTFIVCVWFLARLVKKTGLNMPSERIQDLVIVGFIGGLAGARITYMIQYGQPLRQFFRIWEGGIVLYGGIIAGMLAFLLFYRLFLKKAGVSFWRLVDACGPTLALGIALGRIGCFLNGCCYGHVAPEGCPAVAFPLMTCPAREVVIDNEGYQTQTGFTVKSGPDAPQSIVERIEPESAAERAGLQPGDRITEINGRPNALILIVTSKNAEIAAWAADTARGQGTEVVESEELKPNSGEREHKVKISTSDPALANSLLSLFKTRLPFLATVNQSDVFSEMTREGKWPHGDKSIELVVDRYGQEVHVGPFTPRTIGLHPTQVYETISMLLLMLLLLAFYPFRRHDGQVFELFIVCYAVHRFLNEMLRNDTGVVGIPQLHMTLSQNISVLMLLFALGLELARRKWGKPVSVSSPPAVAV